MTFLSLREALIKATSVIYISRKHSIVVSYTTSSWLHYGKHNSKKGNTNLKRYGNLSQHQKEAELTVVFLSFPKHRDNRPKKNSRKNSFNEISENRLLLSWTEAGVVKEIRPCFYHSTCIPNTYRFRLSLLLTIRMKPWITNTTLQLVFLIEVAVVFLTCVSFLVYMLTAPYLVCNQVV